MKKLIFLFLALATGAFAQVSLTTDSYSEDFNTLAISGTSSVMPSGWLFSEAGTNSNTTYTAGNGSGTAGDTYSFGSTGSTDRALGGLQSGSLIPTFGAAFINNTNGTITKLTISYTGEQWRLGTSGRSDRIDFQYSLDATSLNTGTWIDVNTLDFISPDTTSSAGARDGNNSSYRTTINADITGLNIANGDTFYIRWTDFNASGADDGLAIDDFSMTNDSPLPVELTSFAANILSNGVELKWQTATEVNNYGFDIERSTDKQNWVKLGFVNGNGNSNSPKNYSFVDEDIKNQANGKYYYRLKQIDTDGSYSYSSTIEINWTNGVTDVNDNNNNLPKEFSLSQNYPNPFNPTTKIKYTIPSIGNVETGHALSIQLKVYDILGNEIATLVNEEKTPGEYEVEFNGKGLSSGMYFYKIEASNFVQVRKMILLK